MYTYLQDQNSEIRIQKSMKREYERRMSSTCQALHWDISSYREMFKFPVTHDYTQTVQQQVLNDRVK